jgi:hypothetical protein
VFGAQVVPDSAQLVPNYQDVLRRILSKFDEGLGCPRPLGTMQTDQERPYIARRMVSGVADCLTEFASCTDEIELWDLMELAGQLEIAVDTIRVANGASD